MPSSEDYLPVMADINILENGVRKLLNDLNPSRSSDPDKLRPQVLKQLPGDTASILLLIFRRSLASDEVPTEWGAANVAHLFKKGRNALLRISLTSFCCKKMEHS